MHQHIAIVNLLSNCCLETSDFFRWMHRNAWPPGLRPESWTMLEDVQHSPDLLAALGTGKGREIGRDEGRVDKRRKGKEIDWYGSPRS